MIARSTPLQWPESFARTKPGYRHGARFKMSWAAALKSLHDEMKRRGLARYEYVISSNLPLKNNGDPTPIGANTGGDPGIAVYWKATNKPIRVVACDQFWDPAHNLRALALTLGHLRDMERWGCTQLVEHIMESGFALPGPGETSTGLDEHPDEEPLNRWLTVFGVMRDVKREVAEAVYKSLARKAHPDQGGSTEAMTQINLAWEEAQRWLAWRERLDERDRSNGRTRR